VWCQAGQAGSWAEAHELLWGAPTDPLPSAYRVPGAHRRVPAGHAVRNLWEGGRGAEQEAERGSAVFLPLLHTLELKGYKFGVRTAVSSV